MRLPQQDQHQAVRHLRYHRDQRLRRRPRQRHLHGPKAARPEAHDPGGGALPLTHRRLPCEGIPEPVVVAQAKRTGGSVIARPLTENWAEEDPAIGSVAEATPEVRAKLPGPRTRAFFVGTSQEAKATAGCCPMQIRMIVRMVLRAVDAMELPPNPLDEITDKCGGPSNVAEMTGCGSFSLCIRLRRRPMLTPSCKRSAGRCTS